jgi:hypothetical protein
MRHFTIALLAGAGALFAGSAVAAPITNGISAAKAGSDIEHVRMVCDESGRCYRTRGARRVVVQDDSYAYAPRRQYRQRGYYNEGPSVGVYGAPGVGVSIGVGRDSW